MENQLVSTTQSPISVGLTDSQSFELAQRIAKCFAASSLVPKAYQGNLPNCVIALNMASRMGADPMMVMQSLYVVHGTPSWSAQFLIATFNKCGRFSSIRYDFTGTEGADDWGCRATATELSTGEFLVGPLVTIALAKKEGWFQKPGSKWQTMPEQMLRYRAAAWFVRTIAPEIAMGLQTAEEMRDTYDAAPDRNGTYSVAPVDLNDLVQPAGPADLPGTVIGPDEQPPAPEVVPPDVPETLPTREEWEKKNAQAPQTPPFDVATTMAGAVQGGKPMETPAPVEAQEAPKKNGRPKASEVEAAREAVLAEIAEKKVDLKVVERAVGEFTNRWGLKEIERVRNFIIPSLTGERV